jgi:dephospho-CoA kinase
VIQADAISHELMQPGQAVYEEVVRHFGREILNADGTVNRPRLAEAAFGAPGSASASRVEELNKIVHPAVIRRQDEWMEEVGRGDPDAVAMVEAALILEAGAAARVEVTRRMAAQLPDEEKIKAANFVIDNSGSLDATEKQVRDVWQKLKTRAA